MKYYKSKYDFKDDVENSAKYLKPAARGIANIINKPFKINPWKKR